MKNVFLDRILTLIFTLMIFRYISKSVSTYLRKIWNLHELWPIVTYNLYHNSFLSKQKNQQKGLKSICAIPSRTRRLISSIWTGRPLLQPQAVTCLTKSKLITLKFVPTLNWPQNEIGNTECEIARCYCFRSPCHSPVTAGQRETVLSRESLILFAFYLPH